MPLPKVWNDYDRLDAADLNADMSYLNLGGLNPSGCRGVAGPSAGVTLATGANVQAGLATAAFDPAGMLDAANNRIVCKRAGLYLVAAAASAIASVATAGHSYGIELRLNGTAVLRSNAQALASAASQPAVLAIIALALNDALILQYVNASGSVTWAGTRITELDVIRLGDALA